MNFLSHYYFEKNRSAAYLFGLILPDLYPNFNQQLRKKIKNSNATSEKSTEIRNGIAMHFRHDKAFHQSAFFREKEQYMKANLQLKAFEKERSRPFLFRHIYIEMLMDRVLLSSDMSNGEMFFDSLANMEANDIWNFFKELGENHAHADFFAIFNRFLNSKFLLNYIDNDFFINALIRSYRRVVSYISFENPDLNLLHSFLAKDSLDLKPEIMRFFNSFEYK